MKEAWREVAFLQHSDAAASLPYDFSEALELVKSTLGGNE